MGEEGFKEYRKLITTGIGCLEAVLQVGFEGKLGGRVELMFRGSRFQ